MGSTKCSHILRNRKVSVHHSQPGKALEQISVTQEQVVVTSLLDAGKHLTSSQN